jgi:RNA methyltransferase, TrmH family
MKSVASRQNPIFKRFREAIRDHDQEIVIEGPKPVADALLAGWIPIAIATKREPRGWGEKEVSFSPELFEALTDTRTPQGVLGLFERPRADVRELFQAASSKVIIALEAVQDPGNVGTIVRLAAAFDAAGVVLLPGCADAYGPKAIRASTGAVLNVPIAKATLDELIASELPMYAADAEGAVTAPPASGAILLFGSEGVGVSREAKAQATLLRVAMSDRVESLNVAASAAILLWQSYSARQS